VGSFARVECDVGKLAASLGKDWAIYRVAFKPYPVRAFNQTPVTAALALREEVGGAGIVAVRVRMNPYECGYAGMDAAGPFNSISGTLMSIPFCIALTLVHGTPSMARMTTYDDPVVNGIVDRIALISDAGVPVLSATIEVDTADGRRLRREQRMTAQDYSYDRARVSELVRRIGREESVQQNAFDLVEDFVDQLPGGEVGTVVAAFGMLNPAERQAAERAQLSAATLVELPDAGHAGCGQSDDC
jgi:2-methylcitrate dehydratase PrpD